MKQLLVALMFFITIALFAQQPCEYTQNIKDSIGTYKSTKEYIMYEKNFGGNINYIFYSLELTDGLPTLKISFIQKSKEFIKTKCLDKNSKLFLQLDNGKIISLIHIDQEVCGSMLRDSNGFDNRLLTANFMFLKGTFEDLKSSPVNLMRIKYLSDMEDYVIKKELLSELDNKIYNPETFFINNIHCIE
jgi:uncharacterized radical SAM superfamily Fe-S cluster-containing enzyme